MSKKKRRQSFWSITEAHSPEVEEAIAACQEIGLDVRLVRIADGWRCRLFTDALGDPPVCVGRGEGPCRRTAIASAWRTYAERLESVW